MKLTCLGTAGCADENTVFAATHFSYNGGLLHHQLEQALNPHGYIVAYDGIKVAF